MSSRVWDEIWDELPEFDHVGVDLPGHGATPPLDTGDLPALGRRISRLARSLEARHMIALSFGTLLALEAAIEEPSAFVSIALAAPALAGGPEDPAARVRYVQLAELYRRFGRGPHMTSLWLCSPPHIFSGLRASPDRFERVRTVIAEHRWSELADARTARLADVPHDPARLAGITARVLVVRGGGELPAFVRCAQIIQDAVPDAREVVLPHLGHLPLLEDPVASAEQLRPHLQPP